QEILVDRVALAVTMLPLGHGVLEPLALLGRIGDLGEAIGELDAAGVELESLRQSWIAGGRSPRRLGSRIEIEHGRSAEAELRLDSVDQDAAEDIRPGVLGRGLDARRHGRSGEFPSIRLTVVERRHQVDAGKLAEGLNDRESLWWCIGVGAPV